MVTFNEINTFALQSATAVKYAPTQPRVFTLDLTIL